MAMVFHTSHVQHYPPVTHQFGLNLWVAEWLHFPRPSLISADGNTIPQKQQISTPNSVYLYKPTDRALSTWSVNYLGIEKHEPTQTFVHIRIVKWLDFNTDAFLVPQTPHLTSCFFPAFPCKGQMSVESDISSSCSGKTGLD